MRHTRGDHFAFLRLPIGHIKEILSHGHLVTTCEFYLGSDKRAAKGAHARYLTSDDAPGSAERA